MSTLLDTVGELEKALAACRHDLAIVSEGSAKQLADLETRLFAEKKKELDEMLQEHIKVRICVYVLRVQGRKNSGVFIRCECFCGGREVCYELKCLEKGQTA